MLADSLVGIEVALSMSTPPGLTLPASEQPLAPPRSPAALGLQALLPFGLAPLRVPVPPLAQMKRSHSLANPVGRMSGL